jgi:hypothetical protein
MALDAILEKTTANERRLVLRSIPRPSRLRDGVVAHRGRSGKSTSPLPNTLSSQVESRRKRNAAPQTKQAIEGRHLENIPHPDQVGFAKRTERVAHHAKEFKISSSLCALQIQAPAMSVEQYHCQGITPLGGRCMKPTPSEFCNLHSKSHSLHLMCLLDSIFLFPQPDARVSPRQVNVA